LAATAGRSDRSSTYDAFISYSHALDGELAPALQRGLHQLAKRWYRIRALRVFRDKTSLAASPDLWASVEAALSDSRYFVLLASPQAAASQWVRREVEFWQRERDRRRFFIVVTDGSVAWDPKAGDFDWPRSTALPECLRGYFRTEPLWVDLTWARGVNQLSIRHRVFREAVATLAAPMHGQPKDELDSEDVRQHRLFARARRFAITAMSTLLIAAVIASGLAWQQRNIAQEQARVATSQALASQAVVLADTDPRLAVHLALHAYRLSPTPEAESAIATLVEANGHVRARFRPGAQEVALTHGVGSPAANLVALSADGHVLVYYSEHDELAGALRVYDVQGNREAGVLPRSGEMSQEFTRLALNRDGSRLALLDFDRIEVWDVPSRALIRTLRTGLEMTSVAISPDGGWIAAASSWDNTRDRHGRVEIWDANTGTEIGGWDTGSGYPALRFGDHQRLLVVSPDIGDRRTFDPLTATWTDPAPFPTLPGAFVFPDKSGNRAVVLTDEQLQLWDMRTQQQLADRPANDTAAIGVTVSGNGQLVLVGTMTGEVNVYDHTLSHVVQLPQYQHNVVSVAASDDGTRLASVAEDGSITLSTPYEQNHQVILPHSGSAVASLDGRVALLQGDSGTEVWEISTRTKLGQLPFMLPETGLGAAVDATADGRQVAVLVNGVVSLWDVATADLLGRVKIASTPPYAPIDRFLLRFLPGDRHLICSAAGSEPVLIDAQEATVTQVLSGGATFALSADRNTVASLTADSQRLDLLEVEADIWRWTEDGQLDHVHRFPLAEGTVERSLTLSPDGSLLAMADADGRLHVVDSDGSGQARVIGGRLASQGSGLAFSGNGKILVQDGNWVGQSSLLFWDVDRGELLSRWRLPTSEAYSTGLVQLVAGPQASVVTVGPDEITQWRVGIQEWQHILCQIAGDELTEQERLRYLPNIEVADPCPP
jgi:WD40 repeat protein